ncbi:DHS-like NAD/FAD-binding domain-containing protein [Ascoidea rubescens DSM 1968]|uniref:DHS-like NAD/FAD-binding domain-containing protein n=1 Tax=Ascoidea rubescens DSM 1968 TaxID=1344418 RepID=A0A1D2VF89_9ASCO|nr:DHS-like NAD/FAD-binding domain-containing protein [Ascoidea rubescens DSM 1968]ODV60321.1 DHS-like NAD/FAD-binding domain-containing protein [Ascoidea rubescens DSM 1968]
MHEIKLNSTDQDNNLRLNEVIRSIARSRKVAVLTGAGISCNAGIPDFRSTDGLYNMVKQKHPKTVVKGKDLFDISLFRNEDTLKVFCTFMESLYSSTLKANPTETHKFLSCLKRHNKLLRCYTQNIDGLERKIGLNTGLTEQNSEPTKTYENLTFRQKWKNTEVIQLHGDLNTLSCTNCFKVFNWNQNYKNLLAGGETPECPSCLSKYNERISMGKRIAGNIGMLRPNIVLYGENHPNSENITNGLNIDIKSKPDLLLIFGTSLKVDGVKKLVKTFAKSVHQKNGKIIFINKTNVSLTAWDNVIDYFIETDCDEFIRYLRLVLPDLFLNQKQLDELKLPKRSRIINYNNILIDNKKGLKLKFKIPKKLTKTSKTELGMITPSKTNSPTKLKKQTQSFRKSTVKVSPYSKPIFNLKGSKTEELSELEERFLLKREEIGNNLE